MGAVWGQVRNLGSVAADLGRALSVFVNCPNHCHDAGLDGLGEHRPSLSSVILESVPKRQRNAQKAGGADYRQPYDLAGRTQDNRRGSIGVPRPPRRSEPDSAHTIGLKRFEDGFGYGSNGWFP